MTNPTWCNKGQAQMTLDRHADALRSFDGALKRAPDYMVSLNCKGQVLLEMGRATEALKIFDNGRAASEQLQGSRMWPARIYTRV